MAAKKAKTHKDTAITTQNNNTELKNNTDIQNMIYTVRNQQIMRNQSRKFSMTVRFMMHLAL